MKTFLSTLSSAGIGIFFLASCSTATSPATSPASKDYQGEPFKDNTFAVAPQTIPGRVMCAAYDLGGEGIAYHETTEKNHGSGGLNPADGSYLNEFRISEAVDISYTKEGLDDTPDNLAAPDLGMFYIGWTDPGEWVNYTVDVTETGTYSVQFFCSAETDGAVSLSVDDKDVTGNLPVASTGSPHRWNLLTDFAEVRLEKGLHILTLHTQEAGKMNYAWFNFTLAAI
ncbi:Carbohydrate binding module (family 6) [Bacteroidales bacterium Barb6]|nr:Carbohydrate binding module (family 6) [Bacteroidales bacterium Barb6]